MIDSLAKGNASVQQQLTHHAKQCVKPGYDYFESKFEGDLKPPVLLFKDARYFDPCKAVELKLTCRDLFMPSLPGCMKDSIIDGLKSELPEYMGKAEDVAPTISRTDWWSHHESKLPNWSKACKLCCSSHPQQWLKGCSLYYRTHSKINSTLHWKTILRHLLHYNTTTGHNFVIFHCSLRI